MPINLTNVKGKLNNIKKNLFFEKTVTARFYKVNKLLYEALSEWYFGKNPVSNLAIGGEYFEFSISDNNKDINLEDVIPFATMIEIAGEQYKIYQYFRPRELTQEWLIRLESTGKKV